MSLYAFDAIDDAFEATRAFLWPFDPGRWLRLALIVFFVGGAGSGFNPSGFNTGGTGGGPGGGPGTPGTPGVPDGFPGIGGLELAIVLGIIALVVLLVLLFLVVGSIMEFVLVDSLRREEVTIRRYWSEHWGKGLRLLAFRLVLGIVTGVIIVGVAFIALAPLMAGNGGFSIGLLLLAILVFVVVAIVAGLIHGFTIVFVVPVMIEENRGLLSAWGRLWPTVTGQWKQYAVYAVMGFVLQLAGGLVAGIVGLIGLLVLAIPLGIVGVLGFLLAQSVPLAGWPIVGIAALLFVIGAILLLLFVSVPVVTFLRYYALFVLGDTNEAFDLIPERRRVVREGDEEPSTAAG